MEPTEPHWALAATLREPAALALAFAAHHLALGAAELHLFLDDPADPVAEALAALPRTHVTLCDAAHWEAVAGHRPALQTERQRANATLAGEWSRARWLLHCDADEFLFLRRPLATDLARLGPGDVWLKIPVAERVWVEGQPDALLWDGAFRRPLPKGDPLAETVYGADARLLGRGLAGHVEGKGLTDLNSGLEIGVHAPIQPGTAAPPGHEARHATLLHFDGLTPLHWARKTQGYAAQAPQARRRLLHPARAAQADSVHGAPLGQALALHRRLMCLDLDQAAQLDAAGALSYAHIDPAAALAALGLHPDLTPPAFDAALETRP